MIGLCAQSDIKLFCLLIINKDRCRRRGDSFGADDLSSNYLFMC